jgi:electron transfer flavoprotein beta subunit
VQIIVCVKSVPDSEVALAFKSDGKSIDETNLKLVINPYDEYALEAAVQLKAAHGGEILLICLGDESATINLKQALAMGADRAVQLTSHDSRLADPLQVAKALQTEIKHHVFDLILCGKQAIDDNQQQVGVLLAERLGLPCITAISELSITDRTVTASREMDGYRETLTCALPCLITAEKGLNQPRFPTLRDLMAARKKTIAAYPVTLPIGHQQIIQLADPPTRSAGRIIGHGPDAAAELIRLLKQDAKVL